MREKGGRGKERRGVGENLNCGLIAAEVVVDDGQITTRRVVDSEDALHNIPTQTDIPLTCIIRQSRDSHIIIM